MFGKTPAVLVFYIGVSSALLNPAVTFAPVFLGGMVGASDFSINSAVMILSLELIATALAFLPALWWVARISWQRVTAIALVLVTFGNFFSSFCETTSSLMLLRIFTGVFEGTLLIVYLLVLAQANKIERMFGGKLGIQMLTEVMGFVIFSYIISLWGMSVVYICLALITGLLVFGVRLIPNQIQQKIVVADDIRKIRFSGFICLLLLFFFAAGINTVWTYLERIGATNGLAIDAVGLILAAAVFVAIISSLLCSAIGVRFGRLTPLFFALFTGVLGCLFLLNGPSLSYFLIGVFMIAIARVVPLPYLFGCLAVLDRDKRLTIFSHVVLSLGMATGPWLIVLTTAKIDYDQILWIGVLLLSSTLLLAFKLTAVVAKLESAN